MLNHEIAVEIADKLITHHVTKDSWENSFELALPITNILDLLPPEQRLNPMFLVRALVKQEIITKDDTQDATETLKPLLAEWRAKVKQIGDAQGPYVPVKKEEVEVFPVLAQVRRDGLIGRNRSQAKVFKDIPPPDGRTGYDPWPWKGLDVGHSFFAHGIGIKSARSMVTQKNRKLAPKRFVCREYELEGEKGVMIWRVE